MKKSNRPPQRPKPGPSPRPVGHILDPKTKKPVANPALNKAAKALREHNDPQNLNLVINELTRALLLAPMKIEVNGEMPKPDADGKVQIPKDTKITFALLKSGDGKSFFPAFTNEEELRKWKQNTGTQVLALRFDDFARMLAQNPAVEGFVVDPFGDNLRFPSKMVADIKRQRDAAIARAKAGLQTPQIKPGDKITILEPSVYPDGLIAPVCTLLEQYPNVAAAYLQVMLVNETDRYYLLVLDTPKDEALFAAVAQAARPYMTGAENAEKKMSLNLTTSETPLGQQGMKGSEPFYLRGQGRVDNLDEEDE